MRAFEVVDADGERVRVTAGSDPELFWALRGGGGDFALITSIELNLFETPHLYGGQIVWPADRTGEVFDAFRSITAGAPRELPVWINRTAPPPPSVAEPYLLHLLGLRLPHLAEAVRGRQAALVARLGGAVSGRKPYTFLAPGGSAAQAFPADTLARLRRIKRERDPGHVFRANFPVPGRTS
ncbi:hypothetical protein [Nonomuraea sp. NPDC050691]|uniref:hypothetical protein n=1 Tax=Nonomuraea sp. NPDC050691 TaxID=3155661 RepID=UPI0033C7267E